MPHPIILGKVGLNSLNCAARYLQIVSLDVGCTWLHRLYIVKLLEAVKDKLDLLSKNIKIARREETFLFCESSENLILTNNNPTVLVIKNPKWTGSYFYESVVDYCGKDLK